MTNIKLMIWAISTLITLLGLVVAGREYSYDAKRLVQQQRMNDAKSISSEIHKYRW